MEGLRRALQIKHYDDDIRRGSREVSQECTSVLLSPLKSLGIKGGGFSLVPLYDLIKVSVGRSIS